MTVIHYAKPQDLDDFRALWMDYLEASHGEGLEVLPTKANVEAYVEIAWGYLQGDQEGCALLARVEGEPAGALLWGSAGRSRFETTHGKTAIGWGTYVAEPFRRMGVSGRLSAEGILYLRLKGFETLLGSTPASNEPGILRAKALGFTEHARVGVLRIGKG